MLVDTSWRGIADEPVINADPLGHRQQEWVVVADVDKDELVVFDMRPAGLTSMPVAVGTAGIDDPGAIAVMSARLAAGGDSHGSFPAVETRRAWDWKADPESPQEYPDHACDIPSGQWRRPEGLSAAPGTPDDYPALSYGGWSKPQWADEQGGGGIPDALLDRITSERTASSNAAKCPLVVQSRNLPCVLRAGHRGHCRSS